MTPKLKNIIVTVIILGILFVIYAVFIKPDPTSQALVSNGTSNVQGSAEAQVLGNQIAQALLQIEKIKLDKSLFKSDIYRSLQDRSQPIIDEPIGRSNPFAPIGDISVNSVVRATTSTSTKPSATSTKSN